MSSSKPPHEGFRLSSCAWPALLFLMLCVLSTSLCGVLSSFVDLTMQRQRIMVAINDIQTSLALEPLLDENGVLNPSASAYVEVLKTLTERGLDLNMMQVLFGAFSLAFVTVSIFLLQHAHESVEQVEESARKTAEAVEQVDVTASKAGKQAEAAQQKADDARETASQIARAGTAMQPYASSIAAGTNLVSLAANARFFYSLFEAHTGQADGDIYLVHLRDALKDLVATLPERSDKVGIQPDCCFVAREHIDRIQTGLKKRADAQTLQGPIEDCDTILSALDDDHFSKEFARQLESFSLLKPK